ncbi:MAG: DUF4143 domain-containing protein [Spirochaetaceae bacterium]|nr:DUF4143 domain-containing protein [Spirochaetaceae bacterium]
MFKSSLLLPDPGTENFADVGTVNRLARRGALTPGSQLYGKAFENWLFNELSACIAYRELDVELTYWRLPSGIEVDFVLGDMQVVVEAKASARITRDHLQGLRTLTEEHPGVRERIVVCLEPRPRRTDDGIDVLPATEFVSASGRVRSLRSGRSTSRRVRKPTCV